MGEGKNRGKGADVPGVKTHTTPETPETLTWFSPPVVAVAWDVAAGKKQLRGATGAKQRLESSSHLLTQPELLQLSDEVDHCETQLAVESMLLTKSTYKWQRVMQSWISGMTQEVDAVRQTIQKALATLHAGQAQENQARLQERLKDMRSKTDSTASFETLISTWALVACYANLVDLDDLQETNEILAHLETTLMAKPASDHGADIVAAVEDGLQRLPDILRTAYGENESEHELLTSFSLSRSIARLEMERGRFAAPSMFLGFTTSFFRVMLQQHQQQQPNDCLESLLGLLEQKHAVCVEAVEAVGLCLKSLLGVKREFSELRSLICKMGLQDAVRL
ncbi:unnamed protein product [Schistocephalus solidus]|uniref:Conserved oligomeric Golgi complex subunit 7 n=1 Tax=Schistocephalus solidus TaxID=70667 RepID=A0A183TTC1_SCHSO|nr:unnamed protein product [Schistocephalus solidus]